MIRQDFPTCIMSESVVCERFVEYVRIRSATQLKKEKKKDRLFLAIPEIPLGDSANHLKY